MNQCLIRLFILAALLAINIARPTGPARAQADYPPADIDFYARDALAEAPEPLAEERYAESGSYSGTDVGDQWAPDVVECATPFEPGRPCADADPDSTYVETDPLLTPELVTWTDETQQAWSGGSSSWLPSEDRDAICRIAYAEAANQGEEGIAAVIFTILNRVSSGQFQDSVQGVIDAPNQFEPATRVGGWRYLPTLYSSQSTQCERILDLILTGQLADPTQGALFFQNARIVAARAEAGLGSAYLVDFGGTPPIAEIGDHRFYDARAAVNLSLARWRAQTEYIDTLSPLSDPSHGYAGEGASVAAEPIYDDPPPPFDYYDENAYQLAPVQDESQPG